MNSCPICGSEYEGLLCSCGYDLSCDYERYPTFIQLPEGLESNSARRAGYLASLRRDDCPCCGRYADGDYCGFCGFHVAGILGIRSADRVETIAAAHRERFLSALTDIAVVNYHYRWNAETSRLEMHHADERILADGKACHPGIFWSDPLFGQLDTDDFPTLDLMLSYRWNGARKTLRVTVPTVRTHNFWQVGLLIDDQLRLRVFLGDPTEFTTSEPVALDLD